MNNKSYLKIKVINLQKGGTSLTSQVMINDKENLNNNLDYGYEIMKKLDLSNFKFINFTNEEFKFENPNFSDYKCKKFGCPNWEDILCDEQIVGEFTIKSNCKNPKTKKKYDDTNNLSIFKVFVKGYQNLYDYIIAIQSNKISKDAHIKLFSEIFKIKSELQLRLGRNIKLVNHNLDVNTLHFKFKMK